MHQGSSSSGRGLCLPQPPGGAAAGCARPGGGTAARHAPGMREAHCMRSGPRNHRWPPPSLTNSHTRPRSVSRCAFCTYCTRPCAALRIAILSEGSTGPRVLLRLRSLSARAPSSSPSPSSASHTPPPPSAGAADAPPCAGAAAAPPEPGAGTVDAAAGTAVAAAGLAGPARGISSGVACRGSGAPAARAPGAGRKPVSR